MIRLGFEPTTGDLLLPKASRDRCRDTPPPFWGTLSGVGKYAYGQLHAEVTFCGNTEEFSLVSVHLYVDFCT